MSNDNTKIKLKRSSKTLNELTANEETLEYGEPVFIDLNTGTNKNKYLVIGNNTENNYIEDGTFFNGITNAALLGKTVYADTNNIAVLEDGITQISTAKLSPSTISSTGGADTKYYLLSYDSSTSSPCIHNLSTHGIYITSNGVIYGGAWNDYAEMRNCTGVVSAGDVVCETGTGKLALSQSKLQPLPAVISDTYGLIIGEREEYSYPIAVAGRVLVKIDSPVEVGDVLCAGENGRATKMTRQEIINYPDRILGIVIEIPNYENWNEVKINDRVWIKLK